MPCVSYLLGITADFLLVAVRLTLLVPTALLGRVAARRRLVAGCCSCLVIAAALVAGVSKIQGQGEGL